MHRMILGGTALLLIGLTSAVFASDQPVLRLWVRTTYTGDYIRHDTEGAKCDMVDHLSVTFQDSVVWVLKDGLPVRKLEACAVTGSGSGTCDEPSYEKGEGDWAAWDWLVPTKPSSDDADMDAAIKAGDSCANWATQGGGLDVNTALHMWHLMIRPSIDWTGIKFDGDEKYVYEENTPAGQKNKLVTENYKIDNDNARQHGGNPEAWQLATSASLSMPDKMITAQGTWKEGQPGFTASGGGTVKHDNDDGWGHWTAKVEWKLSLSDNPVDAVVSFLSPAYKDWVPDPTPGAAGHVVPIFVDLVDVRTGGTPKGKTASFDFDLSGTSHHSKGGGADLRMMNGNNGNMAIDIDGQAASSPPGLTRTFIKLTAFDRAAQGVLTVTAHLNDGTSITARFNEGRSVPLPYKARVGEGW